ncbi:MAG: hypothetical protein F9K10_04395, partial [Paludibacter sp.]
GGTSFLWSNGATTQNIASLPSGNYTVAVTNALGCTTERTYSVLNGDGPEVTVNTTHVTCAGGSNGAIAVNTSSGGTSPYTYLWSTGSTNALGVTGLSAGVYTLQITDKNGCTGSVLTTLTEPDPLQVDGITTNINCYGSSTGAVNINVSGGTPGYTYSWIGPGGFTAGTEDISIRPAGAYSVEVTDSKSCSVTKNFTVTQPAAALSAVPTVNNV